MANTVHHRLMLSLCVVSEIQQCKACNSVVTQLVFGVIANFAAPSPLIDLFFAPWIKFETSGFFARHFAWTANEVPADAKSVHVHGTSVLARVCVRTHATVESKFPGELPRERG